jgi:prepilin-type N-terminal cleavage/methylation domain-containing protein
MSTPLQKSQAGFSLIELMLVCAILVIVLGAVVISISDAVQRSQAEQTKIDLTQSAREFVDEFQRDLHQAGYPNCRMIATPGAATNCPPDYTNPLVAQSSAVAAGLVSVSNTQIVFEGDVDGDGVVDTVSYRLVDQNNNYPPATTCPCTIQRSQAAKVNGTLPLAQPTVFSQELQNVVNSGVAAGIAPYSVGSGLPISGNTAWGQSNTAYYAAISTFKDYPVFTAYDENGTIIALPLDLSTPLGQATIPTIKSIRLSINLLANATTGADMKTRVRPVETLVGNARLVNCGGQPCD